MTRRRPVIGIMGAGKASERSLTAAHRLGRLVAERGWIVLTGGRPEGVMAAACAGAKAVPGSVTLGILPSTAEGVGPDVDIAVFTGLGEARNAVNVLTSDVVVACGVEGPGTASEVALALRSDKPVLLLAASTEALAFFRQVAGEVRLHQAETPEDALRVLDELLD
ncbi:MAG: cytochrome [Gemmatimonadales bacterium]